ncbi:hypothetical protein [Aurantiacibacter gangjinensis]|uniref:Uncharacterized protein n=1 Tax=Aurantiacibacter gangjinensis TaxID=502682 RepID=A0A0G9MPZ5_9SPHN|nr:hypothetical protein [Aurantiacibacter gangjinensis]APE28629.1 hypothetical protein BMF35_a1800 [Aurantiacibacter gangjinensis]KLE32807.1 hypothetical protein AAW01_01895 [Aurantiacibacter gangjinensis]
MEILNPTFMLLMAAALCAITALIHSIGGEKELIGPAFAIDAPLTQSPLARTILRFAWHWTTLLWFIVAAVLALMAYGDIDVPALLLGIAMTHLAAGIYSGIASRGQFIGFPLITLIGVLTLLAFQISQTATT